MGIPKEDGFYWAKWQISDDDTPKQYDYSPSQLWETVELYTNDDGERRVYLGGIPGSQSADGFHWHDQKLTPPPNKIRDSADQRADEAFRRYKQMTPQQRADYLAAEDERRRQSAADEAALAAKI